MKSEVMAIPNILVGGVFLAVFVYGLYNNYDKLKFSFGYVITAIIFIVVIVSVFTEAWKIIRGKE